MVLKMHFDNEHYFNGQLKNEVHENWYKIKIDETTV